MGFGRRAVPSSMAIAILVRRLAIIDGFSPSTIFHTPKTLAPSVCSNEGILPSSSTMELSALVYGADGSVVEGDAFENPDESSAPGSNGKSNDDFLLLLLESLHARIEETEVWTRLACAFAPPPHNSLTPETVQDARPVQLTLRSIDVALSVPAEEGSTSQLAQILVTIPFPQAGAIEEDDTREEQLEALVGQIELLKDLASSRIYSKEDDPSYYERLVVEQRWNEKLQAELSEEDEASLLSKHSWKSIALPESPPDLVDEAQLLKKLVNEDEFGDELRALFVKQQQTSGNPPSVVKRASVASLGTSGLCLRARVLTEAQEGANRDESMVSIAVIPYGNPPGTVTTPGELREAVLDLIESVDPMPFSALPFPSPQTKESHPEPVTQAMVIEKAGEEETITDKSDMKGKEEPKEKFKENDESKTEEEDSLSVDDRYRPQPRPPAEEAKLAAKYAAIKDLGERAFVILRDLGMV